MEKWIFKTKLVNQDCYKYNCEDVKLLSVNGIYATVEFKDGSQEEVYAVEVQRKSAYPFIITLTISAEDCEDIIVRDAGASLDDIYLKKYPNSEISDALRRNGYPTEKSYNITTLTEYNEEYYDSDEYTIYVKKDYSVDVEEE